MPTLKKLAFVIMLSSLLLLLILPGCRQQEPPASQSVPARNVIVSQKVTTTQVASETPSPSPQVTAKTDPTKTSTPAGQLETGSTPSIEPTSEQAPAGLPNAIYILTRDRPTSSAIGGPHRLWLLDATTLALEPLSPPDLNVTAVDVQPLDGRLAYGTYDGAIYLQAKDGEPQLIYQAGVALGENLTISGLSWFPDGDRLAFTSSYRDAFATGDTAGLWLLDVKNQSASQLMKNRHLKAGDADVSLYREFIDADFSPDGQSLLLRTSFWEYADLLVLRPVAFDPSESNLYDPKGWWQDGSWAADGDSILVTEWSQRAFTELAQVSIPDGRLDQLVDGEDAGLFIRYPHQLADGIAFVGWNANDNSEGHLYLGSDEGNGFEYDLAGGGSPLCSGDFVNSIDWDAGASVALVACYNSAEIRSLDGSLAVNLMPYLAPLFEKDTVELFWAFDQ